jgi:hypothetical protein
LKEERKFFTTASDLFKKFDRLQSVIGNIERQYKKPVNTYDPVKYVRGGKLLDGERIKFDKPKIDPKLTNIDANKTNFTYEDYKNAIKNNKDNTPNITTDEKKQVDPFSYDGYLQQRNVKVDTSGGNSDYVMDNIMRPKSNTVNYLNFDVSTQNKNLENKYEPSKTEVLDNDVYNPYSQLSFNDIKPVFSNTNVKQQSSSFHNPYENKPSPYQGGNNNSYVQPSSSYIQPSSSYVQPNNYGQSNTIQPTNFNTQFDNMNISTSVYDMNFQTSPQKYKTGDQFPK